MVKRALILTFCLSLLTGAVLFAKGKHSNSFLAGQSRTLDDTCYTKELNPDYPIYYRPVLEPKVSYPFSNDTIGYTYYDYQFNGTQHRQIANDSSGTLHFTWMDCISPDYYYGTRYMDYNSHRLDGTWLAPGGMHASSPDVRAGYGGLDLLPDNREVLCYHQAATIWGTVVSIEDSLPGAGQFRLFDIPDSIQWSYEDKGRWPAVACSKVKNGDTVYVHITHERSSTGCVTDKELGYVRCFESPTNKDTLVCESPGWSTPLPIAKNTKLNPNRIPYQYAIGKIGSGVIATSPVSQKVCLAWFQYKTSSQSANEVMYLESSDNGNDWMAAGNMGTPVQLTNYGASGYTDRAYPDIAAVYDYNDNLHIIWTTYKYYDYPNLNDVTLWHWSAAAGIRKVSHTTAPITVDPGAWNLLIAKFTMGVECMPGDPAYNYLYVAYTKFKEGDVSASGFANGDIYTRASSNGGFTWGPEINLTNTNSNGCTTGNCQSEHWSSIAERVDSFLYVQYIYDLDAGSIPNGEGGYTYDPVRFLRYPRFLVPPLASLTYTPTQLTDSIRWAKNNQVTTDSLIVDNEWGTAALYVKLSGPSWLNIYPSNFSIAEGDFPQKVNLTFNGGGLTDTFLVDSLRIVSNNDTSGEVYSDTDWVRIYFVVTDSFYYPEFDTVNNGTMVTAVSNVGNLANQGPTTGMYTNLGDFLYDFSPVVSINIPGYGNRSALRFGKRNDFLPLSHLKISQYPSLRSTVVISTFAPVSTALPAPYHWFWWWYALEEKEIFFSQAVKPPANPIHYERAILKYTKFYKCAPPAWWSYVTPEPPTLPDAYLGLLADWDILYPYMDYTINTGGFDSTSNLIWIKGRTGYYNHHCGGVLFCCSSVDGDTSWTPFSARVIDNASQIDPFDGPNDDSLYKYMSIPGWSIESDSQADKSILVSAIQLQNPDPSSVVTLKYALMITDLGEADLDTLASQIRRAKCGDVNSDGKVMVADVVYLVNYLFKGGPEPWLIYSDVNGDYKVTVSDVVYLVNYLFKGGPPPLWAIGNW
ncbi:MAG TPA: dockerin type I repeat-containing protein [Terriglobales bacterium]|nr:dockerin type I repeat-containing protein [Terriglobales bacterium]